MSYLDEARRLYSLENSLSDDVRRRESDPGLGSPSLLAITTTLSSYPTAAQSYFACLPAALLGLEVEGGPGSVAPGPSPFFALNLGGTVPPSGTKVLATFVGNRWVFRYDA
jgi:hypothetical protein